MALHHAHDPGRHGESISNPVQIMILSLFFQLLVFFILMNSISSFAPKAKDVIKSMKDSMGGSQATEMMRGSSLFALSGTHYGTGTSLDTLGGAFEHEVPGLTPARVREAGMLEMNFAGSAFNKMLGAGQGDTVDDRLSALINFIKTHEKPRYKIVFLTHIRPSLYGQTLAASTLDTRFLLYWGVRLRQMGVPPERLDIGVAPGHPGSVTVRVIPMDAEVKSAPSFVPPVSGAPAAKGAP